MIETIFRVCRVRFHQRVEVPKDLQVKWPNTTAGFTEPEDELWVAYSNVLGENLQVTIGATKTFRRTGLIIVSCFCPLGKGTDDLTTLTDYIESQFRSVIDDGVVFETPYTQVLGESGRYFQANVICPFSYDYTE